MGEGKTPGSWSRGLYPCPLSSDGEREKRIRAAGGTDESVGGLFVAKTALLAQAE